MALLFPCATEGATPSQGEHMATIIDTWHRQDRWSLMDIESALLDAATVIVEETAEGTPLNQEQKRHLDNVLAQVEEGLSLVRHLRFAIERGEG